MQKKKVNYQILPSDDDEWVIIELIDKKIRVDVKKEILNIRYDCIPHNLQVNGESVPCSRYCCYAGCYIYPREIKFIESILPELKKDYLPKDSLKVLETYRDEFYLPEDYDENEDLYKTRCAPLESTGQYEYDNIDGDSETFEDNIHEIPETHCIFLMENGLCSIHKYLTDHQGNWFLDKFNICTTFPIDLRVTLRENAEDAPYPRERRVDDECSTIKMMEDYDQFLFSRMDCIHLSPAMKEKKGVPFLLDSMKYAFVSRFGEDLWLALQDYAEKYRKESEAKKIEFEQ